MPADTKLDKPNPEEFERQEDAAHRLDVPQYLPYVPFGERDWERERWERFFQGIPRVWDETQTHLLMPKNEVVKYEQWLHKHRVEEEVEKRYGPKPKSAESAPPLDDWRGPDLAPVASLIALVVSVAALVVAAVV